MSISVFVATVSALFFSTLARFDGFDPGVSPNMSGVPGLTQLKNLVGGVMAAVIVLLVLAAIASAVVWAIGSISGRAGMGSGGKTGVLISIMAAIVVGASSFLIKWASGIGQQIKSDGLWDVYSTVGQTVGWC
ncbi:hypothetical protein HMPREF0578_1864 [Mobiluncus mulieris 28-1]|uniref:Integral membrane protein n=1 Tax=Mobiluncus mulieris TaxID=2052 RepID=A0A8G2HQP2_9ACTO|nr:DUF6112 family protein [Mobiluncus mulieris]EEZ90863.1 hypothetical protein HMPREF0578_1864 [Mobiluncus mulieris 28-1]MBB5845775.1 cation transporter-like permease [Mobiluncus mulieris]STO15565.1 Uncharacterised protein [Mobiluncus mulieris]